MPKRKRLLVGHLERVSGRVFEDYRDVIKEMIQGRSGIYALYHGQSLYYVGLASNLMARLKAHLRDRHNGRWDRFSVYVTRNDNHMKDLEALLLRIVDPNGNRQSGRLTGSKNLQQEFARMMRIRDADKRAMLLGGKAIERRQRLKARSGRGTESLKGVIDRKMVLKGWAEGWEYTAALLRSGTISYDGKRYDNPTSAATAAVKHRKGGWMFWHFKDTRGNWVPLRSLRR